MSKYTIIQTDIVQDYIDFINALDFKFQFKDKEAFENDFVILMKDIKPKGVYNTESIFEKFVDLIKNHSQNESLKENAKMAINELKALGNLYGD